MEAKDVIYRIEHLLGKGQWFKEHRTLNLSEGELKDILGALNEQKQDIISINKQLNRLKNCDNCFTDDGYDCRVCIRNTDPDDKPGIADHWVGERVSDYE